MARIQELEKVGANFFVRFAYWLTKRKLGRVIVPVKIVAHHPRLLRAYAHMELGQEAANSVDVRLKVLVQVKVAMLIGCPF